MNPQISVVIPCYKSGPGLLQLVASVESQLRFYGNYEIILVCDACPEGTWDLIKDIAQNSSSVRAFLLGRNVGQHAATRFGLMNSNGHIVITIDDDGQHEPGAIPQLISTLASGADLVYGTPRIDEHSFIRNLASTQFKNLLAKSNILPHAKYMSAFRAMNRRILPPQETLEIFDGPIDSLLAMRTSNIMAIQVNMPKRKLGKSNYNFMSLLEYANNLSLRSTNRSMNLISSVGILGSLVCLLLFLLTFAFYIFGDITVPGYASIFLTLTFGFFLNFWILGSLGKLLFSVLSSQQRMNSTWIRSSK